MKGARAETEFVNDSLNWRSEDTLTGLSKRTFTDGSEGVLSARLSFAENYLSSTLGVVRQEDRCEPHSKERMW